MSLDPRTVRYFSLDVLTLAASSSYPWGRIEILRRAADDETLVEVIRVTASDGAAHLVEVRHVPTAARLAASHANGTPGMRRAILDYDARYMNARDAQNVVHYHLHRTIPSR